MCSCHTSSNTVAFHFDVQKLLAESSAPRDSCEHLAEQWRAQHVGLSADPAPGAGAPPRRKPCIEPGYCVCTGEGLVKQHLCMNIKKALKGFILIEEVKAKVDMGLVIALFQGWTEGLEVTLCWEKKRGP